MSTRSYIGLATEKGIKTIYCHNDGYPEHHLPILQKHYNTAEKVDELLELGYLSQLGAKLAPEPGEAHSFDNPAKGVCVAYHRDRGDSLDLGSAHMHTDKKDIIDKAAEIWIDYVYVFENGEWDVTEI